MNSELNSRIASYRGAEQRDDEHIYYEASMTGQNGYLLQHIIDTFPRILKRKNIRLKPVLLAPRGQRV